MVLRCSIFLLVAGLFLVSSCTKEEKQAVDDMIVDYLHISHTRMYNNEGINRQAARVDYSLYDKLMLGGDMMNLSSESDATLSYLEDIFSISRHTTMWTLGNHDRTDVPLLQQYTGRNNFYTTTDHGITYLVLDTQQDTSQIIGEQRQLVQEVLDTIEQSSHLILLTHHLLWMDDGGPLAAIADSVSNAPLSDCWYCIRPNNFQKEIYPSLVSVQKRGVKVICIAGDLGRNVNAFEYETSDGITYIASGIHYDSPTNQALLMEHNVTERQLSWRFVNVEHLPK